MNRTRIVWLFFVLGCAGSTGSGTPDGGSTASGTPDGGTTFSTAWTKKEDLPVARRDHALVALNGVLYAVGGYSGSTLSNVARYVPSSGSWTSMASLLTARREFAAGAIGSNIYVACGMDYTDPNQVTYVTATEQYDPAANAWTGGRAACPMDPAFNNVYGNVHFGGAAAGGKLYLALFNTNSSPTAKFFEYDPVADRWTAKAPLPFGNAIYALTESSGSLYLLATGYSGSTPVSALARYDVAANAWTILPALPGRWFSALTSFFGTLYAIGGVDVTSGSPTTTASTRVSSFDTQLAAWSDAGRLQVARAYAAAATFGTQLYVAGGASSGTYDAVPLASLENGQIAQ